MADYLSQFTGSEIDARLAKVPQLETGKQDKLTSGTNIKTINGQSVLGSGNLQIQTGETDVVKYTAQTLTEEQKAQARANIDAASLEDINDMDFVTAASLPTASASTMGHIYLIGPDANDNYDRYFTQQDGSSYSWVSLGSTQIDLSTYATKSEVDQLEHEVHNLSGVFYGFFDEESNLPEVENVGYAYVGDSAHLTIYSFDGEEWTNTEIPVQVSIGVSSATASVDANTGTPSVSVSLVNGVLSFEFHNLKGLQGNSGYTGAAGELLVVNNLTDGGATAALAAEMGKALAGYIDDLNNKVGNVPYEPEETESVAFSRAGYYDGSTFHSSTKSDSTQKINITGLSSILYTGSMGQKCATWWDADNNYIGQTLSSNGTTLVEVEVLNYAPENAAYVVLTSRNSTASQPPSSTPVCVITHAAHYDNLQGQIDSLNNTAVALSQRIDNLSPVDIPFSLNGYYGTSGVFTSSTSNNATEKILMSKYKRLILSGAGRSILTFFNSGGGYINQVKVQDIIGGVDNSNEPNIAGIDVFLYAPTNAVYVGVSVRNSTHETPPKATASLIGYNDHQSDFVRLGVIADGATDCTTALQKVLYSCGSEISFPRGTYVISDSLIVNTSIVKALNGNGARIKVTQNVPAFIVTGNLGSSFTANPNSLSQIAQQSGANTIISGFNILASSGSIGIGVRFTNVFAATIQNCYIHEIAVGIEIANRCRNLIIGGNNIYNCRDYGILFASGSNCHQANIYGNHISYSKCCVGFIQTEQTANIQMVGNDVEISTAPSGTPTTYRCIVIDYQNTSSPLFSELEFVGNTIQGHEESAGLIDIFGANGGNSSAQNISFAGNHIGNANGYAVKLKNVHNISFSGNTYKDIRAKVFEFMSTVNGFVASGDICEAGTGFANSDENAVLRCVSLNGLTGRGMTGGITLSCDTIDGINVSGCNIASSGLTISATTIDYVSVTGNVLRGTYTIASATHKVVQNNL